MSHRARKYAHAPNCFVIPVPEKLWVKNVSNISMEACGISQNSKKQEQKQLHYVRIFQKFDQCSVMNDINQIECVIM